MPPKRREILDSAIAEVNLIDQALSSLPEDTIVYNAVRRLISDLRQIHEALSDAIELHATQKDRLSQGVLGSLASVFGTVPSWVKIKTNLRSMSNMLQNLERRASAHQQLLDAIEELRRATQPTRASLGAYNDVRMSEEQAAASAPRATPAIALAGNRSTALATPPQVPIAGLSSPSGEVRAQALRPSVRITFEREYSHLSVLPAQYLERAEDVQNIPHRSSADIPPPEPEAPYIPPNALPLPPRHFYAFGDPAQPERVPAAASGHTRGLSDLSAFKNANRSTSTFSSREFAGSLGPGYSSGSDQPRQIHAGSSVGGDSWGSSERLDEVQNTNYAAGYQSDIGSFDEQPRISRDSESSGSHQGGQ